MNNTKNLDHLVYVVPSLEVAMDDIEQRFGIRPVYGGKHETQGTHNALLGLGKGMYFELIAIDPENNKVQAPRWMGVDIINDAKLSRWAVKTDAAAAKAKILQSHVPLLGSINPGSRRLKDGTLLEWTLTMPLPGPEVEILPFFIDWKNSVHPSTRLETVCTLIKLEATHPHPERILSILQELHVDLIIKKGEAVNLIATLQTPKGIQIIS